jgi:hypothetical protein
MRHPAPFEVVRNHKKTRNFAGFFVPETFSMPPGARHVTHDLATSPTASAIYVDVIEKHRRTDAASPLPTIAHCVEATPRQKSL